MTLRQVRSIQALAVSALAVAFSVPALASANRTFVSTAGNDSNAAVDCSPSANCRTFTAALSVTNSGGEVVVLSSGGYGPFTISQAVTINAIGVDASITAPSSDGVDINTTGDVTISGLNLYGRGNIDHDGINVSNVGVLRLDHLTVDGFYDGLNFAPSSSGGLAVYDSHFSDSAESGLSIQTSGNIFVKDTVADHNFIGFAINAGIAVIEDSAAQSNADFGIGDTNGSLSLNRDDVVQNKFGVVSFSGGNIQFAYCNITQNTNAAISVEGGTASGSNPGTSVVSGSISGSLGTAVALQ